jgi:hypothetical protein
MNNRFELSPVFTIAPERTAWSFKTVTPPVYKLSPERAAFIAAILEGARPEYSMPSVKPSAETSLLNAGQSPWHKGC